jgi:hypothetical protein
LKLIILCIGIIYAYNIYAYYNGKKENIMRLSITVLGVIILFVVSVAGVFAYPVNEGDLIKLQDGPGNTGGGEFRVYNASGTYLFNTFCLETNEYISFGTLYKVNSITTTAINGGSGGGSPDPLDEKTAYLYYNFAMGTLGAGTLTPYNYSGPGHVTSADDLQKAIWYIEEEGGVSNYFVKMAEDAIKAGWSGLGNVRVMNLVDPSTGVKKQDQLTLVPVPEPNTLLLLGAGLIGVGLLRKRFKRN